MGRRARDSVGLVGGPIGASYGTVGHLGDEAMPCVQSCGLPAADDRYSRASPATSMTVARLSAAAWTSRAEQVNVRGRSHERDTITWTPEASLRQGVGWLSDLRQSPMPRGGEHSRQLHDARQRPLLQVVRLQVVRSCQRPWRGRSVVVTALQHDPRLPAAAFESRGPRRHRGAQRLRAACSGVLPFVMA
jgi:hypothetical protein